MLPIIYYILYNNNLTIKVSGVFFKTSVLPPWEVHQFNFHLILIPTVMRWFLFSFCMETELTEVES